MGGCTSLNSAAGSVNSAKLHQKMQQDSKQNNKGQGQNEVSQFGTLERKSIEAVEKSLSQSLKNPYAPESRSREVVKGTKKRNSMDLSSQLSKREVINLISFEIYNSVSSFNGMLISDNRVQETSKEENNNDVADEIDKALTSMLDKQPLYKNESKTPGKLIAQDSMETPAESPYRPMVVGGEQVLKGISRMNDSELQSDISVEKSTKQISFKEFHSVKSSLRLESAFLNAPLQEEDELCLQMPEMVISRDVKSPQILNPHYPAKANKGDKKLSQDIAVFIGQYNRRLRPLSVVKKQSKLSQTAVSLEATKECFKKGILTKIKEFEERDQVNSTKTAVNLLLRDLRQNQSQLDFSPYQDDNIRSPEESTRVLVRGLNQRSQNLPSGIKSQRERLHSAALLGSKPRSRMQLPDRVFVDEDTALLSGSITGGNLQARHTQSVSSTVHQQGNNSQMTITQDTTINAPRGLKVGISQIKGNNPNVSKHQRNQSMRVSVGKLKVSANQVQEFSDRPFIISSYSNLMLLLYQHDDVDAFQNGILQSRLANTGQVGIGSVLKRRSTSMLYGAMTLNSNFVGGSRSRPLSAQSGVRVLHSRSKQRPPSKTALGLTSNKLKLNHRTKSSLISISNRLRSSDIELNQNASNASLHEVANWIQVKFSTKPKPPASAHSKKERYQEPQPILLIKKSMLAPPSTQIFKNQKIAMSSDLSKQKVRTNIEQQTSPRTGYHSKRRQTPAPGLDEPHIIDIRSIPDSRRTYKQFEY